VRYVVIFPTLLLAQQFVVVIQRARAPPLQQPAAAHVSPSLTDVPHERVCVL
jgi:hypothetical protein